jgi:hypothetical protein
MDPSDREQVVERLRAGASVALGIEERAERRRVLRIVERELGELGRTVLWIDLDGIGSGAELGGRIVEACLPYLDVEELGDVLEQVPARGRIELEALAELLMLPERVAEETGRRVVAILDGFEWIERVAGASGLTVVRDALEARDRVSYLFVGGPRVRQVFERATSPLEGLAETVGGPVLRSRRAVPEPAVEAAPAPSSDPLAAALLGWAEPPKPQKRAERAIERLSEPELDSWRRLLEEEERARRWLLEQDDQDDDWRNRRRRRRR